MRKRKLRRLRWTGAYIPLLITVTILLVWHFFRILVFMSAITLRCLPTHEFWFTPYDGEWPLFGIFALIFFLLFVWNAVTWRNRDARSAVDRTILVANGATLVAIGVVLWSLVGAAEVDQYKQQGSYAEWNETAPTFGITDICEVAKPYLGTWEVASADIPPGGQTFPYHWIEFRRDFTFAASLGRFREPVEGKWRPQSKWDLGGWISNGEDDGYWVWRLEDRRLYLTTVEGMELPISHIALVRR